VTYQELAACVDALVAARRQGARIEPLPTLLTSTTEAHAIQDFVAATLDATVGGFKVGSLETGETVRGLIEATMIRATPARLFAVEVPLLGVEAELAFTITRDLLPKTARYQRAEVADALSLSPAIEVVSGRLRNPLVRDALELVADSMVSGALICGNTVAFWEQIDFSELAVKMLVNGETTTDQKGCHATADPLGAAVDLSI
jgi:2-keto-4-pentenoate hydratase